MKNTAYNETTTKENAMPKIDIDALIAKFEENPVAFMAAAGALLMGISKIVDAAGNARGSNAYAKDVNRRVRKEKRASK